MKILKYKNQPEIDLDKIAFIKKDCRSKDYIETVKTGFFSKKEVRVKKQHRYTRAIMFYHLNLEVYREGFEILETSKWEFETKDQRDKAYNYICNHEGLEDFEMSPVRKDFSLDG